MKVKVKLFANFREAAKQKEVEVVTAGGSVGDIIRSLISRYPGLEPLLYQDGRLKPYVNVLLNSQAVRGDQIESRKVDEGDEVALFPPVSGG
jgi:molybdopterin synthase sulfur carrier subunit